MNERERTDDAELQIGDRVELEGEPGRVVGVDHLTGRVTVRWFDDPYDSYTTEGYSSSTLHPRRVRLVERPVRSRPIRCQDKTLAATIEILPCYGGGTVRVRCIRLGEHDANDAFAIIRRFGGEWHVPSPVWDMPSAWHVPRARARELRDALEAEGFEVIWAMSYW